MKIRILFSANTAWGIYNFRKEVITACINHGYEVFVAAPANDQFRTKLTELGCIYIPLDISAKGVNPIDDIILFFKYRKLIKAWQIDVCFLYTVKSNIYGSLAAATLGVRHIPMVTGLGTSFLRRNFISWLVAKLYHITCSKAEQVWMLNEDDRLFFSSNRIVSDDRLYVFECGEGVNLDQFPLTALPKEQVILLNARMLWTKGVGEFIEAAQCLKKRYPHVRFALLGFVGVDNPDAVPSTQIDAWSREGIIEYWGVTHDVASEVKKASCVVLPSYYREGVPLSLLEGAAMGRPLITCNTPGCKVAVDDGVNGYYCDAASADSLRQKMEQIILLSDEERYQMGLRGREKMERSFDVKQVINVYLQQIDPFFGRQKQVSHKASVNVSIVLYKDTFEQVKLLVNTLRQSAAVGQIFLIDNSPSKESRFEQLDACYYFNNKNLGYGKGHNLGLTSSYFSQVPYHLAINADIQFQPDILQTIVDYLNQHPDVGALMPKVYYPNGKTQYLCRLLPSPIDLIGRRFLPASWMRKRIAWLEMRSTDYSHIIDVPHISGCFMMLRMANLEKTGFFDKRYFLYLEDIDLTRRLHNYCRTVFFPDVSIIHMHNRGSYKDRHLLGVHIMNAIRYFNKWGWFIDPDRKRINSKTIAAVFSKKEEIDSSSPFSL
ncbi:MAG: glycosyltransferase [Prevotellaceae bacterium]|jgi:GT2 family glycosyltransferase/glycosyltransferase involved in cell wall biosynthesis|nr:glycosyltransferase [Prevotellaceae bacterium]